MGDTGKKLMTSKYVTGKGAREWGVGKVPLGLGERALLGPRANPGGFPLGVTSFFLLPSRSTSCLVSASASTPHLPFSVPIKALLRGLFHRSTLGASTKLGTPERPQRSLRPRLLRRLPNRRHVLDVRNCPDWEQPNAHRQQNK